MKLFHENPIFETVKSKVIISLFETVRLSVSISPRNLYNSLKSIKEKSFFDVTGKALSGELSCIWTGLVATLLSCSKLLKKRN